MKIREELDIIIEKHHYYESLNKKLLEDESIADYNPFAVGGTESIHDFEGGSENGQKL